MANIGCVLVSTTCSAGEIAFMLSLFYNDIIADVSSQTESFIYQTPTYTQQKSIKSYLYCYTV